MIHIDANHWFCGHATLLFVTRLVSVRCGIGETAAEASVGGGRAGSGKEAAWGAFGLQARRHDALGAAWYVIP